MFQIRERMKALKITQAKMILELQKRGVVVQPPEMSQILSGIPVRVTRVQYNLPGQTGAISARRLG